MCGMPNYMYVFIGVSLLISPGVNPDREAFDPCLHGCKCETVLATNVTYEAYVQKERFQSVDCEYSNLKLRSGFQGEAGLPGDEDDYAELVRSLPSNATALVLSNFSPLEISKVSIQSALRLLDFTVDRCLGVAIFSSAFRGKLFSAVRNIQVSNSQMKLSNIKEETFLYLRYLEKIAVVRNMFLSKIETKAFRALPQIRVINLSTNGIDEIQPGAFYNLSSLTTLDLSYNFLKTIPGEDILKLSVSSLQSLDFRENKWNCSCEMSWILVLSRSVFANPSQALCSYPSSLYGIALQDLKPKNFEHCCPVELMSFYAQYVGFLVILMCAAFFGIIAFINTPTSLQTTVKCGQVEFSTRNPLGRNVFRGKLLSDGRLVAIKKVSCMKQETQQSLQELKIRGHMLTSRHPHVNVIQYVMTEYDPESLCAYIVLELCDGNLTDQEIKPSRDCLLQITKGLSHIHDCGVEHRDIKPANILWKIDKSRKYRFIVADFDLGHITEHVSSHKTEYGTRGWSAPELWRQRERTTAVDIFSLGCVFFYVLTRGGHPFASSRNTTASEQRMNAFDAEAVQRNIENNQFSLEGLGEHCDEFTAELAKNLIESMIQNDPRSRPKAIEVLKHPLFWDAKQQKDFFHKIGNYMEKRQDFEDLVKKLEKNKSDVFQDNWMGGLDEAVKKSVKGLQERQTELCVLLREIRNKIEHFHKLGQELKGIYNNSPEGVVRYYNSKFPKLLAYTYKACKEAGVRW